MNFNETGKSIFAIMTAIVGVAIVAVLVSKKSNTVEVIKAAGEAYTSAIVAAVSPVTK